MNSWRCRLAGVRAAMCAAILEAEARAVRYRIETDGLGTNDRETIFECAVELVRTVRASAGTSIRQGFLVQYGLSTRECVAWMCLVEARAHCSSGVRPFRLRDAGCCGTRPQFTPTVRG